MMKKIIRSLALIAVFFFANITASNAVAAERNSDEAWLGCWIIDINIFTLQYTKYNGVQAMCEPKPYAVCYSEKCHIINQTGLPT